MFLRLFFPYEYVNSVFEIDYDNLISLGYKAIIFDIDNTLVHHGDDANEEIENLFRNIHIKGLKTILLSNNNSERIERFIKNIDTEYISEAMKPKVDNFYLALEKLNVKKDEAIVIGDSVFTDICGANKCGIPNILVKFLMKEDETKIGKKRILEKHILLIYRLRKKKLRKIWSE